MDAIYYGPTANAVDFIFDVTGYFVPDTTGATYNPIPPIRMVDTRYGIGFKQHLTADTNNKIPIAGVTIDGISIPKNAIAVTGNVAVVNPTDGYDIYMGPDALAGTDLSSPPTSVINFSAGQVVNGGVTVKLGADGSLNAVFNSHGSETTDLVFDVTGYFSQDLSGLTFVPATPSRIVDTRHGIGLPKALLGDTDVAETNTINFAGVGAVPGNAKAVTGVVTVVNQTAGYDIYLGPALAGTNPATGAADPIWSPASPPTSVVNFDKGGVVSGSVAIGLTSSGTVDAVFNASGSGKTTDLIFDITGYFVPDTISAGAKSLVLSALQSPLVAGATGSLTVTAVDLYGDPAPDYTGTIHFSATDLGAADGTAKLPDDYKFTPQDKGTHDFPVSLMTAGSWNVNATDTNQPSIGGTDTYILVNPAGLEIGRASCRERV
jgi:hypothetical protein